MKPEQVYRIIKNMKNRKAIKSWVRQYVPIIMGSPLLKVYIEDSREKVSDMSIILSFEDITHMHHFGRFTENGIYPCMGLFEPYKSLESNFYSFLRSLDRTRKINNIFLV
jgi:hypothetical protein